MQPIESTLNDAISRLPRRYRGAAWRSMSRLLRQARTLAELKSLAADDNARSSLRSSAVWALGLLAPKGVVSLLRAVLLEETKSAGVVWEAAKAVVRLNPRAVHIMFDRMLADTWSVRRQVAAWALGLIGHHSSRRRLLTALRGDTNASVRAEAAEALGNIGHQESIEALATALLRDRSAKVRFASAYALGQIGDEAALPVLRQKETDRSKVGFSTVGKEARVSIRRIQKSSRRSNGSTDH